MSPPQIFFIGVDGAQTYTEEDPLGEPGAFGCNAELVWSSDEH